MNKKKIIKKEERESIRIRQYATLKKNLFILGAVILAIGYIFFISFDFDKNKGEKKEPEIKKEVIAEKKPEYEPVEGGTLRLSVTRFSTVDPYKNKENSMDQFLRLVYDSLFKYDKNYNLMPELASGYNISDNSKTLTIEMNPAARWQDGSKVTADDVAYTINKIKNSPGSPYNSLVSNIASTKVMGNSLELQLAQSNSLEAYKLIFPILKKDTKGTGALLNDGEFGVVGNGMFVVSGYNKGKNITLKRNENYHGKKPYINEILVNIYSDEEIRKNMFMSSNVDIIDCSYYDLNKFDYDIFRASSYQSRRFDFITFNSGRAPFDQGMNRKAISKIIDMKAAVEDAYRGKLQLSLFPINNGSELNIVNTVLFDKEQVKKTRLIAFEPRRLKIITDKDDPMRHRMAYIIKDDLSKAGLDSDVEGMAGEDLKQAIEAGNFDIGIFSYQVPLNKDISKLSKSNPQFFNYDFTAINQSMQDVYTAQSKFERNQKYANLQNKLFESMPYLGIGFRHDYKVYNNRIQGELESTSVELYNGIENIFIVEEKQP